jgi:hypothetical protein
LVKFVSVTLTVTYPPAPKLLLAGAIVTHWGPAGLDLQLVALKQTQPATMATEIDLSERL